MALVFDIVRGSFKPFNLKGNIQPSILVLNNLQTSSGNFLVTAFSFIDHEKLGVIQCFDDYNHLYAFGHDPENSAFSVSYTVFLGKQCMREEFSEGQGLTETTDEYLKDRVSELADTIKITLGTKTFIGVVQDCSINSDDPEINTSVVTISGKLTETFS